MRKKFLNECIDCKHIGERGFWKVEGYHGLVHVYELYNVGPEFGNNPEHFDLDIINADDLARKYMIPLDKAEELILNGEPLCPKCKSMNYFYYEG